MAEPAAAEPVLFPAGQLATRTPESGIVEVMNYGREVDGLIPLWAGEGDLPTPQFIRDEAARSLAAGETFYTWQRGLPEFRHALAAYMERLYGFAHDENRFLVTGSGMQSIQIAVTAVLDPGEKIIIPSPAWPNIVTSAGLRGAITVETPMRFENGRFVLDLEAVEAEARNPQTRAIFMNTPSNPTGWVADLDTLKAVYAIAEAHDLWIIADEIYARFVFGAAMLPGTNRAPSFKDVAPESDRVVYVNTMSKNWAMTGWRVGWLEAPTRLGQLFENLIQYSTSGVAAFMQRASIMALNEGDDFITMQVDRSAKNRDRLMAVLGDHPDVSVSAPDGAFYLFFGIRGANDTRALAKRLIDEARIGLAPGTAFGPGGAPFMRLCFARDPDQIDEVAERLTGWLASR